MLGGLIKTTMSKMMASTAAAMAILSSVRVAFAASTGANISPEYGEMLRLAQERVQVATQPGAFGNGVPLLTDITSMLPWIGIAISATIGALIAARILISKMQSDALVVQ